MVTRVGLAWNSDASFWMAGGHVAENMSVCRSARVAPAMARMCGSKPRSSMRSASSSTRYVIPDSLHVNVQRTQCQQDVALCPLASPHP